MKYIEPTFDCETFTCPHCNTLAQHCWDEHKFQIDVNEMLDGISYHEVHISRCFSCRNKTIWIDKQLVYPSISAPEPNSDMPESVLILYKEAGDIYTKSPRSACALLRLAIEKLCNELGEQESINTNIKNLVSKGLSSKVQKALDLVRVIGNNAVHPGQIAFDVDSIETARILFGLINVIVSNMITEPNKIDSLFQELPQTQKEQIIKRDSK